MEKPKKIGVVHGRFQPLHLGHLKNYILKAKERCDHIIIGIANPDPTRTLPDETNIARARPENNPLRYYERLLIINDCLLDAGIPKTNFDIVPFPVNFPQLLKYYVPENATHYLTIFDEWGRKKAHFLKSLDFNVVVLFDKDIKEKKISSTLVRSKIVKGKNWKELVPEKVISHVIDMGLKDRLMKLRKKYI